MLLLILIAVELSTATELEFYEARDIRGINFGEAIIGQALDKGVFLKVDAITEGDCAFKCASVLNCFSYNFYSLPQNDNKTCELIDRVRFGYNHLMIDNSSSTYRGIKTACDDPSICGELEYCKPILSSNTHKCHCKNPYYRNVIPGRSDCVKVPKSCSELFTRGIRSSGVYEILPNGLNRFEVFCDMETDGGGWTVLQRRHDNSTDFYEDWNSYYKGFGHLTGNFWLGNSKIRRLTMSDEMVLRFDLEVFYEQKAYAVYQNFTVLEKEKNFTVFFGEYSGNAGDSFRYHYGMEFVTKDRDHNNCSADFKGGWWYHQYHACYKVNINGVYFQKGEHVNKETGITWFTWPNHEKRKSLKSTEMKIRPKSHQ